MTIKKKNKNQENIFLSKKDVIVVVGVSLDPNKYGNKVFLDLASREYEVYPVHLNRGKIGDYRRYSRLSAIPKKPSLVVTAVKPKITEQIVDECMKLDIKKIWMQPGSESKEAIKKCNKFNINYVSDACIMLNKK